MWDMLGLGLKSQAQGELSNLNDTRTELENYDLGDRFRGFITGVSQEDVRKKAQELADKSINKASASLRGEIDTIGGGLNLGFGELTIRPDETQEDYTARLTKAKTLATAGREYAGMKNADVSKLTPEMSLSGITSLAGSLRDSNQEIEEGKVKTETLRQEGVIADREEAGRTERAEIRSDDLRRQDARLAHERRENQMTRRHNRELDILSGDRTMAIQQMQADLAEKRMNYDRETRRMDKRSQAIAQLMSGLGQLGGAFAL